MKNTVRLFRITHRVTLSILLLLIATIPLIINIDMVTAVVILPAFLIFVFSLSIVIEQKLDTLASQKPVFKKNSTCFIKNCLHKGCIN
jgi:hypothetical protein